jgi:hypothetical protein
MTKMPTPQSRLDDLGDALQAAAAANLAGTNRSRRRRTIAGIMAASAVALPGAALAANALISDGEVARTLPQSVWALMDSHPQCTTIRANVEFDCILTTVPSAGDIPAGAWKDTVEPTVDRTEHVNGGCRSLNANGTHWRCYIGQEAVRQQIVGADFLGKPARGPARG